jgi:hypothetical protein
MSMPDSFTARDGWVVSKNVAGRWNRTEPRRQMDSNSISDAEAARLWNEAGSPSR